MIHSKPNRYTHVLFIMKQFISKEWKDRIEVTQDLITDIQEECVALTELAEELKEDEIQRWRSSISLTTGATYLCVGSLTVAGEGITSVGLGVLEEVDLFIDSDSGDIRGTLLTWQQPKILFHDLNKSECPILLSEVFRSMQYEFYRVFDPSDAVAS